MNLIGLEWCDRCLLSSHWCPSTILVTSGLRWFVTLVYLVDWSMLLGLTLYICLVLQRDYLVRNPTAQDLITNLLPTLLVTGLAILIPLILLLIAKKAHNIVLLSKLHDQILTRYYKFLVCKYVFGILIFLTPRLTGPYFLAS